jgi:hypothetical protein
MRSFAVVVGLLALGALACGRTGEGASCDAGLIETCGWNAGTGVCDRDCHMVCASASAADGSVLSRRCQWDDVSQTYSRDCVFMRCEGGAVLTCPPATTPAATTYFSNDPRGGSAASCAVAADAAAD